MKTSRELTGKNGIADDYKDTSFSLKKQMVQVKKHYKLGFLIGIAAVFASCKRDLETVPIEQQTLDVIFDSRDSAGANANRFLYDSYLHLPTIHNRVGGDYLDAGTDDAISSTTTNTSVFQLATGAYTANNYPDNQWSNLYTGIRQTNIFISNIDRVPLKGKLSNGTPFNRVWKAESKFLRAFYYFELLKRYGGVPLLGNRILSLADDVNIPRSSFDDCVEFIVSECDAIKDSLRTNPIDATNIERPNRAAALALKARVLLYAASPLYNGGNIEGGNQFTGYSSYNAERWQRAANAARELIDENALSLDPGFENVFLNQMSPERIFARQGGNNQSVENNNGPIGYTSSINNGRTSPTQELVNSFGMSNGKSIAEIGSGYNQNSPYENRDPRFYATILYNGAPWLGRPVQTYEGGADKPGGARQQTRTSYYLRKFMGNYTTSSQYTNISHDHILFRYAEVLLNFAEAKNEYLNTPDQDVYNAVESIRKRAGLNPFSLPIGLSKDQMRNLIRNERRVELAFEEHRYWDVRRWKIAETEFNKELHGKLIYKLGSGTLTYQDNPVLQMKFKAPQMYFAPIPYSEVVKNKNMVQNPGW
ncbi:RagB/SusD family nutrient uptake outer membrane protein [Desertivirga arenae]|uniref:RagB/SusD family nutrient uptake outer membrane protein n=1 Tax=Desertivirga arenae TaxID=2810309 RepID=UPI001F6250BC|nr:RagB/SusD family nutrient uptake outer membrane protein [Pedobacter sp. SYSU D00823]